ncbi:MAG: branched-chain amino acid ABC transporter substrate-binding protein [Zoogloea sp.]|nr:branched-chain amino acid ABC transporter substrate-binding protein [Zoogloea sp.]
MRQTLIAMALLACGTTAVQAQEVVKLGVAAPLTGAQSHLGKDLENGARLAVEDYNARGVTIAGKKIRFEVLAEDDQADPRMATTVAQRLSDAGVKGVVGHLNSGASIPASRIYHNAGVPMVSPASTNAKLTQQNFPLVYRTIANDLQQGTAIGRYAATRLGKRIAVIDDRTSYGQGLADEVVKAVKASGGQLVTREFTSDKATDFMAILTKVKSKGADVIVYAGMDSQGGPMLRQIKQLGLNAKFITGDGGCTGEIIRLAAGAISDSAYCTQPGLPLDKMPGGKSFRERFKKRFGASEVQIYAPYAYDAASAIIEAMKLANSVEPARYGPAIAKVNFPGVIGRVAFDARGDIKEGAVTVYQFKGGKWEPAN